MGVNADGSYATKNIEDVRPGDYVLSRPQTDPTAPEELKQVTAVYVHQVSQEQVLTVSDAQGRVETITCTSEHPFYVPGQGWTAAMDLTAGTELTSPDGSAVVVVSNTVRILAQPVSVYNFQVDGDHTYFVDDGAEPVWVHNTCEVIGKAHGVADHIATTMEQVEKMVASGKFTKIFINRAISTATNGVKQSLLRPDIIGVTTKGKYVLFEVVSHASQTEDMMQIKLAGMKKLLGALLGGGSGVL